MKRKLNQQFKDDFLSAFARLRDYPSESACAPPKDNSRLYADPESQRGRRVAKGGQEKDNNSHIYIHWSGLEIRSSTALKLLTIVESKANFGLVKVTWDYSFKSIIERKVRDLWTFLPTRKLSVSCAFIRDQQTNSENKKTSSQAEETVRYLWFPIYIHEVPIV